ncbi:transcriptional regulator, TetR family [Actinobacteria bacterium OK074]|nr:transcriptional regulator, TetR family [Actinobacteria bacterium OK074]
MTGMTTGNTPRTGAHAAGGSRADANRRRILDVALAELLRDPDASMDQIARAAGVVRRTVYGHFPSREALIGTLVDGAVAAVAEAHRAGRAGVDDPAEALARYTLAVWEIADRYRILVSLAQRSVGEQGIRDRFSPVRASCAKVLQQGMDQGVFTSPLPSPALAYVHEHMLFALMEAVNAGLLAPEEAGPSATITLLTTAGVPAARATELVASLSA